MIHGTCGHVMPLLTLGMVESGILFRARQVDGEKLSDVLYEKDPKGYWKKCYDRLVMSVVDQDGSQ